MPPPGPGAKSTLSRENINQNQSQKTAPVHTGAVPSGVGPLLLFSFRAAGGRSGPGRNLVQTFRPKLSPCLRFLKTKGWLFFGKAVSRARWPGLSPALASAEAPAPAAAEAPAPARGPRRKAQALFRPDHCPKVLFHQIQAYPSLHVCFLKIALFRVCAGNVSAS